VSFIDIEEKYKTTALEGHSLETKEIKKTGLVQLVWDVNTGNPATQTHPVRLGH